MRDGNAMTTKGVSIIVINYGRADLVMNFLESIRNSTDSRLIEEVVIVDNGYPKKEDSRNVVNASSLPFKIKFVQNPESSYASGVNRGAALATGKIFIIANNDVQLISNCSIQPLLDHLWGDPHIGIVGPQLVYPDGSWQRSYGRFPSLKEALESLLMIDSIKNGICIMAFHCNWLKRRPKTVNYVDGAFMVVRRSCFEDLGGFDESYSFYGEDVDFCWRAWQKGWKVVFVPTVRVMHIRGATSLSDENGERTYGRKLLLAKEYFIRKNFGKHQALLYGRLIKIALFERALIYWLTATITKKGTFRKKAKKAWVGLQAVKRGGEDGAKKQE